MNILGRGRNSGGGKVGFQKETRQEPWCAGGRSGVEKLKRLEPREYQQQGEGRAAPRRMTRLDGNSEESGPFRLLILMLMSLTGKKNADADALTSAPDCLFLPGGAP